MLCLVYKVGVARCPRFRCIVDEWWGFTYHQNKEPLCDLQHNYWGCKISNFSVLELGTFPSSSQVISFSSVQFSHSVVSDSLWPHESQHARPPCTSPTPRVYSNSCPLSRWCYPAISSCHPLLLPPIPPSIRVLSNESTLHIRWPKYWSFSISISPSSEYSQWFLLGLTGLSSF